MIGGITAMDIDLNGLRQRSLLSMSGATLRNPADLAGQLGFGCRALKVPLSSLDQVALPAIIHWDLDHFVVLKRVTRDRIEINDPARGARANLDLDEASKHFTGVVLELEAAAEFNKIEAKTPIKINSLWSRSTGIWSSSIQVVALSIALQLATFAAPFQMQLVVDEAIGRNDADLLTLLAVGFGFLRCRCKPRSTSLRSWSIQVFGNLLSFHLTGNLVRHLLKLPASFFEKRHVGDILSRMGSSSAIKDAITQGVVSALIDGVMAIIALVILLIYSPLLTGVVLVAVMLTLGVAFLFYPISRARNEERLFVSAKEQSYLMETVRAAATIKVMGREAERESGWRNLYANVVNASLKIGRLQVSVGWLQNIIMGLQGIIVLFLAAKMVITGSGFSIGMLFAFSSFRQTFMTGPFLSSIRPSPSGCWASTSSGSAISSRRRPRWLMMRPFTSTKSRAGSRRGNCRSATVWPIRWC